MIKQMAADLSFTGRPVPVALGTFLSTFLILEHYSTPWALLNMFARFEQNWRTLSYSHTVLCTVTFFVIWASLEQYVVFGMNAWCHWNSFVRFTKLCFANLSRQLTLKWLFRGNVFASAPSNSLARFMWRVGEGGSNGERESRNKSIFFHSAWKQHYYIQNASDGLILVAIKSAV